MAVRRRAIEYRSEQVWGDLPVVHVSVGGRQADGRYRLGRARGIIALGTSRSGWWRSAALLSDCSASVGSRLAWWHWAGWPSGCWRSAGWPSDWWPFGAVAMGLTAVGALTAGLVGVGPRPPVGSATRRELLAEGGRVPRR
jgi:hypothetical protein